MMTNRVMKIVMACLCLSVSGQAQPDPLDDLVANSDVLLGQIDQSIAYVGWTLESANQGLIAANGLYQDGLITQEQLDAYNDSVAALAVFNPFGSSEDFLLEASEQELANMGSAVDSFTDVVVGMTIVLEVTEMAQAAEAAADPQSAQDVVEFMAEIEAETGQTFQISTEDVAEFNQSVEDIDNSAGAAAAYIAVASNEEATTFLDSQAVEVNDTYLSQEVGASFSRETGAVSVEWTTVTATSDVYVNGVDFGIDAYVPAEEVLASGYESTLYMTGPTATGFACFYQGVCEGGNIEP
tara:strand:- start:27558 stop:28448 length:891 start_codon:yes stop_codon:yes gene_type:complete